MTKIVSAQLMTLKLGFDIAIVVQFSGSRGAPERRHPLGGIDTGWKPAIRGALRAVPISVLDTNFTTLAVVL